MNKILSRIAIAIASFAMVLGGVSIASINHQEQAKPAYAETGDVVATFESEGFVNYGYTDAFIRIIFMPNRKDQVFFLPECLCIRTSDIRQEPDRGSDRR